MGRRDLFLDDDTDSNDGLYTPQLAGSLDTPQQEHDRSGGSRSEQQALTFSQFELSAVTDPLVLVNHHKASETSGGALSIIGRPSKDMEMPDLQYASNSISMERGSLAAYEPAGTDSDGGTLTPDSRNAHHDRNHLRRNNSRRDSLGILSPDSSSPLIRDAHQARSICVRRTVATSASHSTALHSCRNYPFLSTHPAEESRNARLGASCFKCMRWHLAAFWWRLRFAVAPEKLSGKPRSIFLNGKTNPLFFPPNIVSNHRYNIFSFIPLVLYGEFRFFFNIFYLVVALAQFVPQLKVGPLFTYVTPLSFVLLVTLIKEAYDDYQRKLRDKEINSTMVEVFDPSCHAFIQRPAAEIRVGNLIRLHTDQRVPCDAVLLKTSNPAGTTFIRTDQLDGETDWKLRRSVAATQSLHEECDIPDFNGWLFVEAPHRDIYDFVGTFFHSTSLTAFNISQEEKSALNGSVASSYSLSRQSGHGNTRHRTGITDGTKDFINLATDLSLPIKDQPCDRGTLKKVLSSDLELGGGSRLADPVSLENTIWSTTVVTDGPVYALAIYTGRDMRASLSKSKPETKTGLFDAEVNRMSKVLFVILVLAAAVLVTLKGYSALWVIHFCRFVLLLSSIIPISLRVTLDLAKAFYAYSIQHDPQLRSVVVRNSSIPEELGRIDFLLTDKTGTLTQNEMVLKRLHIGRIQFSAESLEEIAGHLRSSFAAGDPILPAVPRRRLEVWELLRRTLIGLSICHNVTPIKNETSPDDINFQAASPDEIAIVRFTSTIGLQLMERTDSHLKLIGPNDTEIVFNILYCFPFSSEAKRMGVIVQLRPSPAIQGTSLAAEVGRTFFFLKGAESVMVERIEQRGSHWLQEECDNFARVGLRTLVIAVRELTPKQLESFSIRYHDAQISFTQRALKMQQAIDSLEVDMTVLGLTGVEDRLQPGVSQTVEAFRHAGIRVWMLTGDKIETATCIAIAAGLKSRQHTIQTLAGRDFQFPSDAQEALEAFAMGQTETVLVIDGPLIDLVSQGFSEVLIRAACQAPAVICCRCSPSQKETIVRLIQNLTHRRCAAVGDGGNDVSMIQAAHCGIGIVGKEGKQASLAADFSIHQFDDLHRLLFWHGRNCYQRSAKLAHFVMHRGLIIASIQVIFSAIFFFIPLAIFQGWLTVGYATYYTVLPVCSLVLDIELPETVVFMFPELYESLRKGRVMSSKTFFAWLWTSVYQGAVIMLGAILLFESDFTNIISITFTSLILSELLNVASEITSWNGFMIGSQIVTVIIYFASMALLPYYFNLSFIFSFMFWFKVTVITLTSWLPLCFFKILMKFIQPTRDSKLTF